MVVLLYQNSNLITKKQYNTSSPTLLALDIVCLIPYKDFLPFLANCNELLAMSYFPPFYLSYH